MARVVPSQVRAFIEQVFQFSATQQEGHAVMLSVGHSAMLAGVVDLIDHIPDELITLDGPDYATFRASLAAIRDSIALWRGSDRGFNWQLVRVEGLPHLNPVTLIRHALLKCPDEAPAPGTLALVFVTDRDLRDSIRLDISAANRDFSNGEWKGATILAGSAVEALLLWVLQEVDAKTPNTIPDAVAALLARKALAKAPNGSLEWWDLHEYIEVTVQLGVIKPDTVAQARQARGFRNLIHPGRAQRRGQKCDRGTALAALAAVEFVVRDLTP